MANRSFSSSQLYTLRNQISVKALIEKTLHIPCRVTKGCFRFLCPLCGGYDTAVNPKTNLARCFQCEKNYNTIDLVMLTKKRNFIDSVKFLQVLGQSRTPDTQQLHIIAGSNPDVDNPNRLSVPDNHPQRGMCHIGKTIGSILPPANGDIAHKPDEPYEPVRSPANHQTIDQDRLAQLERQLANLGHQHK